MRINLGGQVGHGRRTICAVRPPRQFCLGVTCSPDSVELAGAPWASLLEASTPLCPLPPSQASVRH